MLSLKPLSLQSQWSHHLTAPPRRPYHNHVTPTVTCCSAAAAPPVTNNRKRYRKPHPGEATGITEEMRFVAMKLRNIKGKYTHKLKPDAAVVEDSLDNDEEGKVKGKVWVPTVEGLVKFLVDSKLVFETLERIVGQSDDVSFGCFRKTGLERAEGLGKDLEWLRLQGHEIPEPGGPGISYAKYLEELAGKSTPVFLSHYYNIYFSHIAGGQVITRQVSDEIFEGRELEFCKWEEDVEELLKVVRNDLNLLSKKWARTEKTQCLKEATKCFNYMGQIVRLVIL